MAHLQSKYSSGMEVGDLVDQRPADISSPDTSLHQWSLLTFSTISSFPVRHKTTQTSSRITAFLAEKRRYTWVICTCLSPSHRHTFYFSLRQHSRLPSATMIPNSRGQVPAADLEMLTGAGLVSSAWHDMAWHQFWWFKCNPITSHPLYPCRAALTGMFPIPMSDVADMACLSCWPHSPVKKSCDRPSTDHKSKNTPPFFVYFVVHDSNSCLKTLPSPQFIFLPYTC
jgi:hypothetical protein